jgi:broad specificity phosphatase PhoE
LRARKASRLNGAFVLLVRHGPVALDAPGLLSFRQFCAYVEAYERAGLAADAAPAADLARIASDAISVFASDAPRVADTLMRLGLRADGADAAFREAPPLAPPLPFRLPAIAWLALARARGAVDPALSDARRDLRQRADAAALRLIDAAGGGPAALIGHGWFNRAVACSLSGRGWRRSGGPGLARPWGYAIFAPPAGRGPRSQRALIKGLRARATVSARCRRSRR